MSLMRDKQQTTTSEDRATQLLICEALSLAIVVMNLNPVKDSCGREEKKRDEKILVDADARHLKAPGDGDNYN